VTTAAADSPVVSQPSALSVRGVSKRFRHHQVLECVDLDVRRGEAVALVGENGAGKTTLLRICAGLVRADAGVVSVDGSVGYCPQQPTFLESLRVDEHLILFGRARGLDRDEARARGRELLVELDFKAGAHQPVRELSGGARQKLNVALALLGEPTLMLLDEPYQGFDRGSYISFWDHINRWRDAGRGVLVVTHLLAELDRVDRIVGLRAPAPRP
jgi:ABC-type multidrug transport system ATPase subunit